MDRILDYVCGDDWKMVFIDGLVWYANHSVPDFFWLDLLSGTPSKYEVRRWETSFENTRGHGITFTQLEQLEPDLARVS